MPVSSFVVQHFGLLEQVLKVEIVSIFAENTNFKPQNSQQPTSSSHTSKPTLKQRTPHSSLFSSPPTKNSSSPTKPKTFNTTKSMKTSLSSPTNKSRSSLGPNTKLIPALVKKAYACSRRGKQKLEAWLCQADLLARVCSICTLN